MFYVYILYSAKVDRFYVGYTSNVIKRIAEHNIGKSTFTSIANDWVLKYNKGYTTRALAHHAELAIKKKKSRIYIEWLVQQK